MRLTLASLSLFLTLSAFAAPAYAAPGDAKLAEALFATGKEAMAHGDLATACARFAESLKLDPAPGTLLNLAACEEKSGKLVDALNHFVEARAQLPKDDFRIPFTTEQITSLARRVARIIVRLTTTPSPGTRVLRDGTEVTPASFNVAIQVNPGPHVIVVEASGRPADRTEFNLAEGEERIVSLRADASPAALPTPAPAPSSDKRSSNKPSEAAEPDPGATRKTLAFVAAGVGAAGLVTGTVTGLVAIDAASTYKDHCTNGICDPEGLDAAKTGRTVRVLSPIAFGASAVFALASVYLFLSAPAAKAASRFVPIASASGGGLSLVGTF